MQAQLEQESALGSYLNIPSHFMGYSAGLRGSTNSPLDKDKGRIARIHRANEIALIQSQEGSLSASPLRLRLMRSLDSASKPIEEPTEEDQSSMLH